jgi:hypothetical protein
MVILRVFPAFDRELEALPHDVRSKPWRAPLGSGLVNAEP